MQISGSSRQCIYCKIISLWCV